MGGVLTPAPCNDTCHFTKKNLSLFLLAYCFSHFNIFYYNLRLVPVVIGQNSVALAVLTLSFVISVDACIRSHDTLSDTRK